MDKVLRGKLATATNLALADEWHEAHVIVQEFNDPVACWIHAVLHKIEGDESNSRYWYARTNVVYEDYMDAKIELDTIAGLLSKN